MKSATCTDPASRSAVEWRNTLASLKSHAVPDDDPRVLAARAGLSYHRARKVIEAESGDLSRAGVDRLTALLGTVAWA